MTKLYILPIEPLDTRYTKQWYSEIPKMYEEEFKKHNLSSEIIQVDGDHSKLTGNVTPGAFLNFKETNIWKSTQFANLLEHNINDGDVILYTDAWNTTILQLKYILSLQNINAKIMGIWHAGSYDPQDFLGRIIGDAPWVRNTEHALFESLDLNVFATKFHAELFQKTFNVSNNKILVSGLPMRYLPKSLIADLDDDSFIDGIKKNQIVFPHRLAPEKQVDIFKDLARSMPDFNFIICQEKKLSMVEYHRILAESILCFSANLQETFGIGQVEATYLNTIPFCPNRLSYSEMYLDDFLYPSEWTENYNSYLKNKDKIIKKLYDLTDTYKNDPNKILDLLSSQQMKLDSFILAQNMINSTIEFLKRKG